MEKLNLVKLQKKTAVYENLPHAVVHGKLSVQRVSDQFFSGPTNYWYPTSVIGLSLRVPIFSGFFAQGKNQPEQHGGTKTLRKTLNILEQSLNMAFMNARMKLDDTRHTIACNAITKSWPKRCLRLPKITSHWGFPPCRISWTPRNRLCRRNWATPTHWTTTWKPISTWKKQAVQSENNDWKVKHKNIHIIKS